MALICDTGPLLAALDRDAPDHESCSALIQGMTEDLIVPGLVLAELDYWCSKLGLHDPWLLFLEDVDAGPWRVTWPLASDLRRARELEYHYADLGLGVVDASIMALAERLGEDKIATLDRRHFGAVRPVHTPAFRLLPIEAARSRQEILSISTELPSLAQGGRDQDRSYSLFGILCHGGAEPDLVIGMGRDRYQSQGYVHSTP